MSSISKFLKSKTIGFFIIFGGVVSSLISLLLYALTGVTEFSPNLDSVIFITGAVSIVFGIASMVKELKLLREGAFLLALYSFIAYVGSQANYIANLATNIDNSAISMGFVFSIIFFLLAFIADFVSIFFSKQKEDETAIITTEK